MVRSSVLSYMNKSSTGILLPSGFKLAGKVFVTELARLLQAYADGSSLDCVALKAFIVLQVLLIDKKPE